MQLGQPYLKFVNTGIYPVSYWVPSIPIAFSGTRSVRIGLIVSTLYFGVSKKDIKMQQNKTNKKAQTTNKQVKKKSQSELSKTHYFFLVESLSICCILCRRSVLIKYYEMYNMQWKSNYTFKAFIPVCSYLCRRRELLFWNVLSHKSHAYMPLSVFLIFFRDRQESESVMSSRPDM